MGYYKKYLKRHNNENLININFETIYGLKNNLALSKNTTIKEMIKIYLFETNIPLKYKNNFQFNYNTQTLDNNDNSPLYENGFNEGSTIKVIENKIIGDNYNIKGKQLKANFKDKVKNKIIKTYCIGTLNQVKDLFSLLNNDLPQNPENNKIIKIGKKKFEYNEEKTFSFFGIRKDFNFIYILNEEESICSCIII